MKLLTLLCLATSTTFAMEQGHKTSTHEQLIENIFKLLSPKQRSNRVEGDHHWELGGLINNDELNLSPIAHEKSVTAKCELEKKN